MSKTALALSAGQIVGSFLMPPLSPHLIIGLRHFVDHLALFGSIKSVICIQRFECIWHRLHFPYGYHDLGKRILLGAGRCASAFNSCLHRMTAFSNGIWLMGSLGPWKECTRELLFSRRCNSPCRYEIVLVACACCLCMNDHPLLTASWADAQERGVATQTPTVDGSMGLAYLCFFLCNSSFVETYRTNFGSLLAQLFFVMYSHILPGVESEDDEEDVETEDEMSRTFDEEETDLEDVEEEEEEEEEEESSEEDED